MTTDDDRTVHAEGPGVELVRYERAGKWFIEYVPPRGIPCRHVRLDEAVAFAVKLRSEGGRVHLGRRGGTTFERLLRARHDEAWLRAGGEVKEVEEEISPMSAMALDEQEWADLAAVCRDYLSMSGWAKHQGSIYAAEARLHPEYVDAVERRRALCTRLVEAAGL